MPLPSIIILVDLSVFTKKVCKIYRNNALVLFFFFFFFFVFFVFFFCFRFFLFFLAHLSR